MTPPSRRDAPRSRRSNTGAALALLLPLAACAGEPTYYALKPFPGRPRAVAVGTVEVRTPTVAGYLDRDYIVEGVDSYRLTLAGNDAWGEPIADMIGHAVAGDLAERLTDARVVAEDDAVTAAPAWTVELAIERFDRDGGDVVVSGTLAVRGRGGATNAVLERFDLRQATPPGSTASLVATLSALTGALADRIAGALDRIAATAPATPLGDTPPPA